MEAEKEQTGRQAEYDWLRSISCVSIVILHIAAMYMKEDMRDIVMDADYMTASFWRVLSSLAVPSFVMLSGAFLIKDENANIRPFFLKTVEKIILPTLLFSILYVLMHYGEIILAHVLGIGMDVGGAELWAPLWNWLQGRPHITLWYMYMIIPLYLITPIIVMIRESISEKAYVMLAVVMMGYSVAVAMSCSLSWILQFASWIGYFMLGGVIRAYATVVRSAFHKVNWRFAGCGCIGAAYVILIAHWYLCTYRTGHIVVPGDFSMPVIAAVLLQFWGIAVLPCRGQNRVRDSMAKDSLLVYLIHPMFCEVIAQVCWRIVKRFPTAMGIPIYAAVLTVLCVGIAKILSKFRRAVRLV